MKPKFLVYILTAMIIAFVIRGYTCAEEMRCSLHAIEIGGSKAVDFNGLCTSVEGFKKHLLLSGVFAVVIAICCKLKAPK
tara:strand:- start:10267 stop:10506 length:240 start_codon:yes stop_codon:yes gene_type:complete